MNVLKLWNSVILFSFSNSKRTFVSNALKLDLSIACLTTNLPLLDKIYEEYKDNADRLDLRHVLSDDEITEFLDQHPTFKNVLKLSLHERGQIYWFSKILRSRLEHNERFKYPAYKLILRVDSWFAHINKISNDHCLHELEVVELLEKWALPRKGYFRRFFLMEVTLSNSNIDFSNRKISKYLKKLCDLNWDAERSFYLREVTFLVQLQKRMGSDSQKNKRIFQLILQMNKIGEEVDKILKGRHQFLYEAVERSFNGQVSFSRKEQAIKIQEIKQMSPEERGTLFTDLAAVQTIWFHDEFWLKQLPKLQISFEIERIFDILKGDVLKTFNRQSKSFTPSQADELISLLLIEERNFSPIRITIPTAKSIAKSLTAGRPHLAEQLIAKKHWWLPAKALEIIVNKLNGEIRKVDDTKYLAEKYLSQIKPARSLFIEKLKKQPPLWIILPNKIATGPWIPENQIGWDWLDHQALLSHWYLFIYISAIYRASHFDLDISEYISDLNELAAKLQKNIDRLASGEGGYYGNLREKQNIEWKPNDNSLESRILNRIGGVRRTIPTRDEIIKKETEIFNQLSQLLDKLMDILAKPKLLEFKRITYPLRKTNQPSKKQLNQIESAVSQQLEQLILSELNNYEPRHPSYLSYANNPRDEPQIFEFEQNVMRGLVWSCHFLSAKKTVPILIKLAGRCYASQKDIGIKAELVGNSILWVLENYPTEVGIPALIEIRSKVVYPKIRRLIDKSIASNRSGLKPDL